MCRLAAIISKNVDTLESRITAMTEVMHRGGPDDFGHSINRDLNIALGHRRLAIIDISPSGHQPMQDDNEEFEIVFNGEIYNYKILKEELQKLGHFFKTESDTEVLIKGYKQWGSTLLLNKIRGMYAFVLIDKKNKSLFAARDHAGIKPLYIGRKNDDIYFSSEIRGIKAVEVDWEENKKWPIWFLSYGFLPEPITTLKNVQPLPRGHYISIDLETQKEEIVSYCKYEYKEKAVTYSDAVEQTRKLLDESIKRHLIADVPVGIFLSGGIDSSILTIAAQKQLSSPIETLSIYFDDEKFSEKEYQDIIVKQTGVKHHSYKVAKEDFLEAWDDIYDSLDQPSTDAINTYFISKFAKQNGLKVVLSGLGADEIFGGYPSIERVNKFNTYKRVAVINQIFQGTLLGSAYPKKKIEFLNKQINSAEYLLYRGLFTPKDTAKILDINANDVWEELSKFDYQEKIVNLNPQNKATYFETAIYMQNQLLKDSDMQSMWHSLELRVPFLDRDLMEYINNLHPSVKFPKNQQKIKPLLVDAYINELPEAIWNRPKKGFTFPFENWFQTISIFKNNNFFPKKFLKIQTSYTRIWAIFLTKIDKAEVSFEKLNKDGYFPQTLFTYLTAFRESGGIQKVNKAILKALPNTGKNSVEAWGIYDTEVDTNYLPAYAYKGFKGDKVKYIIKMLASSFKWKHIIVGHINIATVVRLVKIINPKIKITLIAHGIDVWDKKTGSKKWLLQNANKIISVSIFTKNELININKVDANKIIVLPNCLDPFFEQSLVKNEIKKTNYLSERYSIGTRTKIILTVSRIRSTEKYKGYDKVLEALSRIKQTSNMDFIYLLCGSYDNLELARVTAIIDNLKLQDNVKVTGFVPDNELVDHYYLADVFIMPSKKEGFGIVFIEAAVCGTQVISGNSDGSVEAMLNGELGQMVNPDSVDEIYNALLISLSMPTIKDDLLSKKALENYNFRNYSITLNNILFNQNVIPN